MFLDDWFAILYAWNQVQKLMGLNIPQWRLTSKLQYFFEFYFSENKGWKLGCSLSTSATTFYGNWFSGFSTTTILNYSALKILKKFYRTLEYPLPGPMDLLCNFLRDSERFENRSNFKSNLLLIFQVKGVLNRTVAVDNDWHFRKPV